jgi:hypothetical protein
MPPHVGLNKTNNDTNSELKILLLYKNATNVNLNEIVDLRIPYWISASFSSLVGLIFIATQCHEAINRKRFKASNTSQLLFLSEETNSNTDENKMATPQSNIKFSRLKKFLFNRKSLDSSKFFYMIIQTLLFIFVFFFNQAYISIITRYMLTYLTLGPAKLDLQSFIFVETIYWIFFIFGRFMAAYLTFRSNSTLFFLNLLTLNLFACFTFIIPILTKFKWFFWLGLGLIGLTSGPIMPTGLMVAKKILNFNSFILSLFIISVAAGGIVFQQLAGKVLDNYKPNEVYWLGFEKANSSFVLPYMSLIASFFILLFYIPIYVLYKLSKKSNTGIAKFNRENYLENDQN